MIVVVVVLVIVMVLVLVVIDVIIVCEIIVVYGVTLDVYMLYIADILNNNYKYNYLLFTINYTIIYR